MLFTVNNYFLKVSFTSLRVEKKMVNVCLTVFHSLGNAIVKILQKNALWDRYSLSVWN